MRQKWASERTMRTGGGPEGKSLEAVGKLLNRPRKVRRVGKRGGGEALGIHIDMFIVCLVCVGLPLGSGLGILRAWTHCPESRSGGKRKGNFKVILKLLACTVVWIVALSF